MPSTAALLNSLEPAELDGVLALHAALRYGLDVEILPRQVLILTVEGNSDEMSFVHGISGSTGLAPVTYAQDKRMRRAQMERVGVPIPKGATFSLGYGSKLAARYARQIGYPITVKPAVGDNGIEAFLNVHNRRGMQEALAYLSQPTTERETFTRASYGLTELREPGIEDGKVTVPPGYLFIVEKHVVGQYLRFLVIDGEVVSAILCEGYPVDRTLSGGRDVLNEIHPELVDLASRAGTVIPGIPVAAVDIVVPNPSAPLKGQVYGLVEYSERPYLWVQGVVDPELPLTLSDKIFRSYADELGVALPAPRDEISLSFDAMAIPDARAGVKAIEDTAAKWGFQLQVSEVDQLGGSVSGSVSGNALLIATFADALLGGKIDDTPVMMARFRTNAS